MKITPSLDRKVFIAGYENNRIAESVHDDLWARALVLDDGTSRFAVVACDLIGLANHRVRKIRQRVTSVPAERVLIVSTHVHSGPDTLGLWGPNFLVSGLDAEYMAFLEQQIGAAIDAAVMQLRPVTASAGATLVPDGLVYNSREPLQDKELTTLRLAGPGGATVATVVHYGGHPEVNKSKAITSDFVHYVRHAVEKQHGGVAIFLNGALGGMVTPQVSGHTLPEMERVGTGVGAAALKAIEGERAIEIPQVKVRTRTVPLALENDRFKLMANAKVLDAGEPKNGGLETEVWRVDLGPMTWVTIPGEVLPKPALALKEKMPGRYRMVVALGNDELGYLLDPEDFDRPLYKYEKSMSVGRQAWPTLLRAAQELLKD